MLAVPTVKSSGIDVAIPAIFPTVFALKFSVSANFLSAKTIIYLEITTSIPE